MRLAHGIANRKQTLTPTRNDKKTPVLMQTERVKSVSALNPFTSILN